MLNPVGSIRHIAVGAAALASPLLVLAGVMGGGRHQERFDAKQVLVTPLGDGVRIRETVDQDFGDEQRHGLERVIPNDFGVPTDVEATSPDAPDAVSTDFVAEGLRIRIGDPDTTIDGQHRYVLSYTLPDARLSTGTLALDIIEPEEPLETGRFQVVLAGFELQDPLCNVGSSGTSGGCELTRDGDLYTVTFEPLKAGDGITIGGTIVSTSTPADVPIPDPIEHRKDGNPLPLAAGTLGLGAFAAVGGYRVARRLGRNVVGGAGAADAAYGTADGPTRLVTDKEMDALVTTEFEPPRGIRPWQAAILLREQVDSDTVSAWFSDQIALGVVTLDDDGKSLKAGPALAQADPATRQRIDDLLDGGSLDLGTYQPAMDALWKRINEEQRQVASDSGWWAKFAPGSRVTFPFGLAITVGLAALAVVIGVWTGLLRTWPLALLAGFAVPAVVAGMAYRRLLPQRSAAGSALALRTESFRRFLQASEGQHVDWAWKHNLLREYSAWAVALGAADAWGRAVANSAVPPPEIAVNTMPLLVYSHASVWSGSHTKPAPSGGSGGGGSGGFSSGFSGGSVGGGGGGGSSGSW